MKTTRLTLTAIFASLAIALSTLENFIPISAFIPIPGLKLGIANLAVMAALYFVSPTSAFTVGLIKVTAVFLTFGNASSLVISSLGTLLSFLSLVLTKKAFGRLYSFMGVSAISAVCHATGQVIGACLLTRSLASTAILLPLGLCSALTGMLCGFIMNGAYPTLYERIKL